MKIELGAVGTFLAKVGVIETPEWWWYGKQSNLSSTYVPNAVDGGKQEGG